MSGQSRYIANAASMLSLSVVQKAAGILTTLVLARMLNPVGLGAYAVTGTTAGSVYGLIRLGADAGVHVLTAERESESDADFISEILSQALVLFFVVAVAGAAVCFLLSDEIANRVFGDASLTVFVQIAAALLFFQMMSQFAYTSFAGLHAFPAYVKVMAVMAPVTAVAAIAGALQWGAVGAAAGFALGQGLTMAALLRRLAHACRSRGIRLTLRPSRGRLNDILKIGFPFYAAGLVQIPAEYLILGLMVRHHDISSMGDLRVVLAVTSIVSFLPTAVAGPMISALARAHADKAENYWRLVVSNLKVLWFVALVAMTGLGILWDEVIRIGFGAGYHSALTVGYIALLTAAAICVQNVVSNTLFSMKRVRALFLLNTLGTLVFVAVASALVPGQGLAGLLIAQAAGVLVPLAYIGARFLVSTPAGRTNAAPIAFALASTVAVFALVVWANATVLTLLTQALIAAAVCGTISVFWLRFVFDNEEVDVVLQAFAFLRAAFVRTIRGRG